MARAPTTASAASTQKSIASMHSPLSLAVGYNRIVTHSRRSCNNVVAILAKDKTPSLQRSSRCRAPASILPLAAPQEAAKSSAACALRPLRVAQERRWCDHAYPGGTGTTLRNTLSHPRARRTGFYHRVGALTLRGSDPSLCPAPIPKPSLALTPAVLVLCPHTPRPRVRWKSRPCRRRFI